MLQGKKLFEICEPDKFWQWSGKKIHKIQDSPVIQGRSCMWRSEVFGFTENRELRA